MNQRPLISRKVGYLWSRVYAKPIRCGQLGGEGLQVGSATEGHGAGSPANRCVASEVWDERETLPPLLLTPFSDLQVQIHAHPCGAIHTTQQHTHTHHTRPRERAPSYTQTLRPVLCARARLHTRSHRPTAPSHTHTPPRAYVCRPTDMPVSPLQRHMCLCTATHECLFLYECRS